MIYPSRFETVLANDSGFGFISMVFIVLVLALGTVGAVLSVSGTRGAAENRATVNRAKVLQSAIAAYRLSHGGAVGAAPATLDALVTDDLVPCALDNNPANAATYLTLQGWCGPYADRPLADVPDQYKTDGWGVLYQYVAATQTVTSCGPDRICGNGDDLTFNP